MVVGLTLRQCSAPEKLPHSPSTMNEPRQRATVNCRPFLIAEVAHLLVLSPRSTASAGCIPPVAFPFLPPELATDPTSVHLGFAGNLLLAKQAMNRSMWPNCSVTNCFQKQLEDRRLIRHIRPHIFFRRSNSGVRREFPDGSFDLTSTDSSATFNSVPEPCYGGQA